MKSEGLISDVNIDNPKLFRGGSMLGSCISKNRIFRNFCRHLQTSQVTSFLLFRAS